MLCSASSLALLQGVYQVQLMACMALNRGGILSWGLPLLLSSFNCVLLYQHVGAFCLTHSNACYMRHQALPVIYRPGLMRDSCTSES